MWNPSERVKFQCYLTVVVLFAIFGSVHGTINVVTQITEAIIISFEDTPSMSMPDEKVEYGIDVSLILDHW